MASDAAAGAPSSVSAAADTAGGARCSATAGSINEWDTRREKKAQDSVLTSVAPPLAVRASCRSVASVRLTPQGSGWGTRASVARIPTRLQINRLQIKEPP